MSELDQNLSEAFIDTLYTDLQTLPKKDLGLIACIQPLTLSACLMLYKAKHFSLNEDDYNLIYETSSNILHSFVTQAPVAVALLDMDLKYRAASTEWYHNPYLVNKNTSSILEKKYQDVSAYVPDAWLNILKKSLKGEIQRHSEDLWLINNDIYRWVKWEIQPWYVRRNQIGGIMIYFEDMTEHRDRLDQIEQLLREKDELEAIAYMCPHDLQAHIRTLSSFIKLLSQDQTKQNSDKYLSFIQNSLESIKNLVHDSLMHARLKTMELEKKFVDLNELLHLSLQSLKNIIENRDAKIVNDPLPYVFCHAQTIRQVFENIIANALKFSPQNQPRIEITSTENDHYCQVNFKDYGVGITVEDQQKVFDNFYRVYSEQQFPGTGLGLSLCRKVVEKHGGRISVHSKLGEGSTFTLTFPKQ